MSRISKELACLIFGILLIPQWTIGAIQSDGQNKDIKIVHCSISLNLPDSKLVTAYQCAAEQSVLPAINPKVFFGYWSVCADGVGHGYGNTYPSLDGHQMTDALLWLGKIDVVKANWEYVKNFQRPNGQLPLAILPSKAGKKIGRSDSLAKVDENGGLYRHWVKGDPLRALAGPTYIQNADVIYRYTQNQNWLLEQLPSVNKAADYLETLMSNDGAVKGAGYYIERPTRIEYDGVAQCHAIDAFRRVANLNAIVGKTKQAKHYNAIADKIENYFQFQFWCGNQFAEYIHPDRGPITTHGLTDTDWSAIAMGIANTSQINVLWPQLKNEPLFYYGGVPTGIAAHPEKYEAWEFAYDDQMDLAAMGRVWYLEAQARARMGDSHGLLNSIRLVCERGEKDGYYWRERYNDKGGFGAKKYCEYPANLIRVTQRFLLGADFCLDGAISLAPVVPGDFWKTGFGQTLLWQQKKLSYLMTDNGMEGDYSGPSSQQLRVKLQKPLNHYDINVKIDRNDASFHTEDGHIVFTVPDAKAQKPLHFVVLSSPKITAEQKTEQPTKPKAYVYSLKTISQTPDYYCGWPTVTKTADGELLAVYSGHREWHVCPFGRIEMIRSADNGQTWSKPEVVLDTILDDRDTGICQTPKSTLLVTWFTSTYWTGHSDEKLKNRSDYQKMLDEIKAGNYRYESIKKQVKDRFGDGKKPIVDQWLMRSEDNGKTWSAPYLAPLMAPHGPIVASDGKLLWAGKDAYDGTVGFCESTDDGKTWKIISQIPPAPEQTVDNYHELHIAEAADGTLIAHIRNHNKTYKGEILQTESKDDGQTWIFPHSIGVACSSHPSHLLCLKDDTLLMTYGDRKKLQLQARISRDNGKTWSDAMVLADKLHTWDFGYPSTVQLDDSKLLTIWYEVQSESPNAVIRQAIWKLD